MAVVVVIQGMCLNNVLVHHIYPLSILLNVHGTMFNTAGEIMTWAVVIVVQGKDEIIFCSVTWFISYHLDTCTRK